MKDNIYDYDEPSMPQLPPSQVWN